MDATRTLGFYCSGVKATLALALLLALGACDDGESLPDASISAPSDAASQTMSIPLGAGQFSEATVQLAAGASVRSVFSADGPVYWNFHTHVGGNTQYVFEGTDASHDDTYTAGEAGEIYLMWQNPTGSPSITVMVTLTLSEGATLTAWN